jgi:hypothetical protein
MLRAGNPYDNAHFKTIMKILNQEQVYLQRYRTMGDLMTGLPARLEHT